MEQWKPIVVTKNGIVYDYTGKYEVSSEGRIRSLNYKKTGKVKILKLQKNSGYMRVQLMKHGKMESFSVGRIVAEVFIPNPENKPEVNHINEDKTDNRVENLEWSTRQEQVTHGTFQQRRIPKVSQALKNKPKTEQHKKKISETLKGKKRGTYKKS